MTRTPIRRLSILATAALALLVGSCSDGKLKVYPVSGQVLYNSEPLKGVDVAFHAVEAANKVPYPPHATTDADGRFTLMSYVKDDGCPAGEFQVAIAFAVEVVGADDGGDQSKKLTFQVPLKYHKVETSGLKVTIKPEKNDLEPFKLEGPAKRK
jgi:hypothetical protein